MKKILTAMIVGSSLLLAGCMGGGTNTVSFDGLLMNIPQDYATVSPATIDDYQIVNKILKAYKFENQTLIIARSALNANMTPQEYATTSKERLAQAMPGYEAIDDGTVRFECEGKQIEGYTHSFAVTDPQGNDNPGSTYIIQYYFIAQGTPYIISQADRSRGHYSDFTSMVNSLHCS